MEISITKAAASELKGKPDESDLGFGSLFSDHMFVMTYSAGRGWHDAEIKPYQNFSLVTPPPWPFITTRPFLKG